MVEQYKVGTALVKTFSISGTTPNPAVSDISSLYNEINYYESIDSPAVTMTASIVDSTDLKSSLPIVGGEGIVYDFSDSLQESISITGAMRLFKLALAGVCALGLTRDPYSQTGNDNMWINVGVSQFHLPTAAPSVLRGTTVIVMPKRSTTGAISARTLCSPSPMTCGGSRRSCV